MAHYPKPYFRKSRGCWYVQIDGRETTLGKEKDQAFTTYHGLMAARGNVPSPSSPELESAATEECSSTPNAVTPLLAFPIGDLTVPQILDEFLDWCESNRAPDTYRWHKDRINSFCNSIPADLKPKDMKPFHVQKWVNNYGVDLASGTKRNLIASVKCGMAWAEEQGYIPHSPIAKMRKPACGRKEQIVTPEHYEGLLDLSRDQNFRDLLTVSWETGCRPQESLRVEGRHLDTPGNRWAFPVSEAKGKKKFRVVYLTPFALEICQRLAKKHPTGPLFRNEDGRPWTPCAVNCRFSRAKAKIGIKFCLYNFRHTWITRKLISGVDAVTVAVLVGQSDPSMIARTYAHLTQAPEYLLQQARRAS